MSSDQHRFPVAASQLSEQDSRESQNARVIAWHLAQTVTLRAGTTRDATPGRSQVTPKCLTTKLRDRRPRPKTGPDGGNSAVREASVTCSSCPRHDS